MCFHFIILKFFMESFIKIKDMEEDKQHNTWRKTNAVNTAENMERKRPEA